MGTGHVAGRCAHAGAGRKYHYRVINTDHEARKRRVEKAREENQEE